MRRGGDIHISSSPREATQDTEFSVVRRKFWIQIHLVANHFQYLSGQSHYTLLPGTKSKIFLQVTVSGKRALMEEFIVFEFKRKFLKC